MIYNINISNKAIIDNEVNISLQQAYLLGGLHAIVSDWEDMSVILHQGRNYFWFAYDMLLKELPLLRSKDKQGKWSPISKDAVYRQLKDLCDEGFLLAHPDNQKQGRAYYAFSSKLYLIFGKKEQSDSSRKNATPTAQTPYPYGANTVPPTVQTPYDYSTKDNNTKENTLAPIGAIPAPPEKKQKEDYSEFAAYCQQHGFEHILKIPRLLTKEKVAAKRKDQNELAFYETVLAIDTYLKSVAPRMPYKDLNLVWKQYAFSNGLAYTKNAYNSLYLTICGKDKESYTKSEIEALGAIWRVLEAATKTGTGESPNFEQVCASVDVFFGKFPAHRRNDTDLKPAFIHADAEAIIREIRGQAVKKASAQPRGGVVVTQELVDGTIDLVRQRREQKKAEEQAMRDAGLIP